MNITQIDTATMIRDLESQMALLPINTHDYDVLAEQVRALKDTLKLVEASPEIKVTTYAVEVVTPEPALNITVDGKEFKKALKTVEYAVAKRSSLPILGCVKIVADMYGVRLTTTNLEVAVTVDLENASIESHGSVCIEHKALSKSLTGATPAYYTLEQAGDKVVLTGKARSSFKAWDVEEYPNLNFNHLEVTGSIAVDRVPFLEKVMIAAAHAATDDSRPVLTGILIEQTDVHTYQMSAADSFRLAVQEFVGRGFELPSSIIIPAKELLQTVKAFSGTSIILSVLKDKEVQRVRLQSGNVTVVMRLITGTFPNVHGAVPKEHTTRVVFDRKALLDAVEGAVSVAKDAANITRFTFGESIKVEANNQDGGEYETELPYIHKFGPDLSIIHNFKYVIDALKLLKEDELAIDLISNVRPSVIHQVHGDPTYKIVIMPMSTNR